MTSHRSICELTLATNHSNAVFVIGHSQPREISKYNQMMFTCGNLYVTWTLSRFTWALTCGTTIHRAEDVAFQSMRPTKANPLLHKTTFHQLRSNRHNPIWTKLLPVSTPKYSFLTYNLIFWMVCTETIKNHLLTWTILRFRSKSTGSSANDAYENDVQPAATLAHRFRFGQAYCERWQHERWRRRCGPRQQQQRRGRVLSACHHSKDKQISLPSLSERKHISILFELN